MVMKDPVDGADLGDLVSEGVSPWPDGLDRRLSGSGWFASVAGPKGLRGAMMNLGTLLESLESEEGPARRSARPALAGVDVENAVMTLILDEARTACDVLNEVFTDSDGYDGQVSVDLPARVAHDAGAAVAAAERVVAELDRPNVMVKLPATAAGLAATRSCLSRGIGVHVTGVCSPGRYGQVVDAWFDGMEAAAVAGLRLATIPSVAAAPVGRIDQEVDARLAASSAVTHPLRGRAALATAQLLYHEYEQRLGSSRWRGLQASGARPQRLAWTATTPAEAGYAVRIVGWGTVTAMSPAVLDALGRAGELAGDTLLGEHGAASAVIGGLDGLGMDLGAVVRTLEADGVEREARYWSDLCAVVRARSAGPGT